LKDDTLIVWQVWEWKAEREYAEMGGGSKQQKLGLGTEKETRSTYRRTLPRPHVRRIYQHRTNLAHWGESENSAS
jgi:hypothetical protein